VPEKKEFEIHQVYQDKNSEYEKLNCIKCNKFLNLKLGRDVYIDRDDVEGMHDDVYRASDRFFGKGSLICHDYAHPKIPYQRGCNLLNIYAKNSDNLLLCCLR